MKEITFLFFLFVSFHLAAQEIIPLYPGKIPNSIPNTIKEERIVENGNFIGYSNVSKPTLEIYLPDPKLATGTAVIICPGGSYSMLCYQKEGIRIAETFLRQGIAAFILKYRLPSDSIMKDKSIGPLQDAQQAIKTVRQHAKEWKLRPDKIGIMGFSAGGHLASTAGTHFDKSYIPNVENISLRPDFLILVYPVISMNDKITHIGSRTNLLGTNPEMERISLFSNEMQVNRDTPPVWLTHTCDDTVVPVENSIRLYQQLVQYHIPAEMHLFPQGNHGFVLNLPTDEWMQPLFKWINKI
ncbi:MAG: alpha/beta hydrolase [Bacteroidota bacterium]|nr:alpha/beta hydrolase [Bacteroidota bacterium]